MNWAMFALLTGISFFASFITEKAIALAVGFLILKKQRKNKTQ